MNHYILQIVINKGTTNNCIKYYINLLNELITIVSEHTIIERVDINANMILVYIISINDLNSIKLEIHNNLSCDNKYIQIYKKQ